MHRPGVTVARPKVYNCDSHKDGASSRVEISRPSRNTVRFSRITIHPSHIAAVLAMWRHSDLSITRAVRHRVKALDPERPPERFFEALRKADERLLALDYDGTLAPFTARREDATLYPGLAPLLAAILQQETRIAFVTGRPAEDLATRIPLKGVEIFGAHGQEHIALSGRLTRAPLSTSSRLWLDASALRIAAAGFGHALERKYGTVAIHWRRERPDDQVQLEKLARDMAVELPADIQGLAFDGGYEFRVRGRDKGTAIADLIARHPQAIMAYLGDDMTDEDAFIALPCTGLAVLVRDKLRDTHAHLWLRPPKELHTFLRSWMTAVTS